MLFSWITQIDRVWASACSVKDYRRRHTTERTKGHGTRLRLVWYFFSSFSHDIVCELSQYTPKRNWFVNNRNLAKIRTQLKVVWRSLVPPSRLPHVSGESTFTVPGNYGPYKINETLKFKILKTCSRNAQDCITW